MREHILLLIAIIAFFNVLLTEDVSAQASKILKVSIDFDFNVLDKYFPAGEYTFETSGGVLVIRNVGENKSQFINARHSYSGKIQPRKLVFERRGESFFLTGVFPESGQWGFFIPVRNRQDEKNTVAVSSWTVELPTSK
jgi:hypothetical protein